jgi:hypothetical protein
MPSGSLNQWTRTRVPQLNQMEDAHRSVGGADRGRRYATMQINHAYVMLLSSHFQGYCRDLHSECVNNLISKVEVPGVASLDLRNILHVEFLLKRKLDVGNPSPGNLGEDFNRFGLNLWASLKALDARNASRQNLLEELNAWRNAIAHQNFNPVKVNSAIYAFPPYLRLKKVRDWRQTCERLTEQLDQVMGRHIGVLMGNPPW